MEVVTASDVGSLAAFERADRGDVDRGLIPFSDLDASLGENERLRGDDEAIGVEGLLGNKEVRDAGFVLEADEAETLGRAGPLAADHHESV